VPFAVKLNGELVKRLQAMALDRQAPIADVVTELLEKGLERAG
jgi:predicted DNA-binding protein